MRSLLDEGRSIGSSARPFAFVDDTTAVSIAGQRLRFVPLDALSPRASVAGSTPHGIALVATSPAAGLFAFTEKVVRPSVQIHSYPDLARVATIRSSGATGYSALCLTRDGSRLVTVSDAAPFKLSVWDWRKGMEVLGATVATACVAASVYPGAPLADDTRRICIESGAVLTLWQSRQNLEQEGASLTALPLVLPDEIAAGAAWGAHTWGSAGSLFAGTDTGVVALFGESGRFEALVATAAAAITALEADSTHLLVASMDGTIAWHALPTPHAEAPTPQLFCVNVGGAVATLAYSPVSYTRLGVSTATGAHVSLTYVEPFASSPLPLEPVSEKSVASIVSVSRLSAFPQGPSVAVALLAPTAAMPSAAPCVVVCSPGGAVGCYDAFTMQLVAEIHLPEGAEPTTLACSAPGQLVAVGSAAGVVRVYSLVGGELRLVLRSRLSRERVLALAVDAAGEALAVACDDARIYWINLANAFGVCGANAYTPLHASAPCVAWCKAPTSMLLATTVDGIALQMSPLTAALSTTGLPPVAPECPLTTLEPRAGRMEVGAAQTEPAVAIAPLPAGARAAAGIAEGRSAFYALSRDGTLRVYALGEAVREGRHPLEPLSAAVGLAPVVETAAPEKPATSVAVSADGLVVATGAKDGTVTVRSAADLGDCAMARLHDSVAGGVSGLVALAPQEGSTVRIISAGADGVMHESLFSGPALAAAGPTQAAEPRALPATALVEDSADTSSEPAALDADAAANGVGGEARGATLALQAEFEELSRELQELWVANEQRDEDDPERLPLDDLVIDLDQQRAWRDEAEEKVRARKAEITTDIMTKQVIARRMKAEFWDAMETPAASLHPMGDEQASTAAPVSSYALPHPTPRRARALAVAKLFRSVENLVASHEAEKGSRSADGVADALGDSERFAVAVAAAERSASDSPGGSRSGSPPGRRKQRTSDEAAVGAGGEDAFADVRGAGLEYKLFEVTTHWRRAAQLLLVEELVRGLRERFNERFNEAFGHKTSTLDQLREKQARVSEIAAELRLLGAEEPPSDGMKLGLHPDEEPDKVLRVADSEVNATRWIPPEEQVRLDRLQAEAQAREAAANADSVAKRGLVTMMNNSLEIRSPDEAVFDEVVPPPGLEKPEEEQTAEDKAAIKGYEERRKNLAAEREKRSNTLLAELGKVRDEIGGLYAAFNSRLASLSEARMSFDEACHEAELLRTRWSQAQLSRELITKTTSSLLARVRRATDRRDAAADRLDDFSGKVAEVQRVCEALATEDKKLDREYRREATEHPDFADALLKLYRRRAVVAAGGASRTSAGSEGASRDPFPEVTPEAPPAVEPLVEGRDAPEGLPGELWTQLVEARDQNIAVEAELTRCTAKLADMTRCLQALSDEEEAAQAEFDDASSALSRHRQAALVGAWDVELPFKLRQGQVEVEEAAVVTDYARATLMPRVQIERLNAEVKRLGGEKVAVLEEIRDFRRGIVQLQWDTKRVEMEISDLVEKTRDVQLLRVTKSLQEKLQGGSTGSHAAETASLERKYEHLTESHAEKVADLKRQHAKYQRLIAEKEREAESLGGQIAQLESSVTEREAIRSAQLKGRGEGADTGKRFEEVHAKSKLSALAKTQVQEIGMLREELDRMRRRTFPTFTHIESARAAQAGL